MPADEMRNLILFMLALPAAAAVVVAALGARNLSAVRWTALASVLLNLVMTGVLVWNASAVLRQRPASGPDFKARFEPIFVPGATAADSEAHSTTWNLAEIPYGDVAEGKLAAIQFFVGLDGLNIWLVALTSFLMLPSVLVSWNSVKERANEFYAWLLVLQSGMLGVFLAFDIVLFYVFFELTLVPLFFLIGIWGGPARREAARKFFLFTLAGSLITLLGMIGLIVVTHQESKELTFSIPRLVELVQSRVAIQDAAAMAYWRKVQIVIFLALTVGFAVKVPLFPLHTWLPLAHVEAPTAGSVLLAGVLLKLGTYGFLRLALPLVPDAARSIGMPLIGILSVIGILYGAFCAFAQNDIKKMVAYSSVSHLGFCMLGMFALNDAGIAGSLMQMVNHGLSTGGLFLLVGMIYDRYHTRMMTDYGGMAARLKLLALFMVFICLTSVGIPFLNGFVGEMLILGGVLNIESTRLSGIWLGAAGAAGIVLGAWYLFTMLQRVFFGPLKEPSVHDARPAADLNLRELAALVPLGALCLLIGVYPQPMLDAAKRDIAVVVKIVDDARLREAAATPTLAESR